MLTGAMERAYIESYRGDDVLGACRFVNEVRRAFRDGEVAELWKGFKVLGSNGDLFAFSGESRRFYVVGRQEGVKP